MVSPYAREINFSEYTLRVKTRDGQQVLSQGEPEYGTGEVFFKNRQKLPGITLCIGNYHKKEIEIGNLHVEFYYFPDHELFFEGYTEIQGEKLSKVLAMLKGRLEARIGRATRFKN